MKALGIEFILSGRTVEFTPNEFLAPIKKAVSETARLKLMVRTNFYNEPDTLKNPSWNNGTPGGTRTHDPLFRRQML